MPRLLILALLASCGGDISFDDQARCDGVLQEIEGDVIDAPFDRDKDGFVDVAVADCVETYDAARLDCNDGVVGINPGAAEIGCNGLDDDCDALTIDGMDADADGVMSCDDCDDDDALAAPGQAEVCGDTIDNDCDQQIDEQCAGLYDGMWDLDEDISFSCGSGAVHIDFDRVILEEGEPLIRITAVGSNQPGEMVGDLDGADFEVEHTIEGSCNEEYQLQGTFTSPTTFEGTFRAHFYGFLCLSCKDVDRTWPIAGTLVQ